MSRQKTKTRAKQSTPYTRPSKESGGETTATKEAEGSPDDEHSLKCDKCEDAVDGLIQCESCLSWFCCSCGDYPHQAIEIISVCKTLHWYCDPCDNRMNSGTNSNQSMTTTIEKSIASCFEKVSNNLITLVKQQLSVPVVSNNNNMMEVEGNDSVSRHDCDTASPHTIKLVILSINILIGSGGRATLFTIYLKRILIILNKF